MLYRRFGRTELPLSALSLGCMRSMQSWQDLPVDAFAAEEQRRLETIVTEALRLGINHIETARAYGSSERQLGAILPKLDRGSFFLQTKVAPEDDPELFTAQVCSSIERLGLGHVDLLTCHGLNTHRQLWQLCRPGGCLTAARRLQRQGKLGWIGVSGHGSADILMAAVRHGADDGFDYINLHWYTIFQRNTPVLEAALERDMGVFIISPTDKGGMLHRPPALLRALSAPYTPMQFNDLFCLMRPEIHTISIGAARPDDFHAHVASLAHIGQEEEVTAIYQRWQQAMAAATGQHLPDAHWPRYPAYDETPGYINLPYILWLQHLVEGWDLRHYAAGRYARLGQDIRWVPGNNAARMAVFDWSAICERHGLDRHELCERLQQAHTLLSQPVSQEEHHV